MEEYKISSKSVWQLVGICGNDRYVFDCLLDCVLSLCMCICMSLCVFVYVWRVDLTVGVVWRAGRPRGLAQAGRGMRRSPLLPCCQEYLHVPSTTLNPRPVGLPTSFPCSQR